MADSGVGTGIGIGLGNAMQGIAEGITRRSDRLNAERDKQADAYEQQARDIAANIAKVGGKDAPEAAPLMKQLTDIVTKHNSLYPPHETPALVARIQKFVGKKPSAPTPDTRAGMTAETVMSGTPQRENTVLRDLNDQVAAIQQMNPQMSREDAMQQAWKAYQINAGVLPRAAQPRESTTPKFYQSPDKKEGDWYVPGDPGIPEGWKAAAPTGSTGKKYQPHFDTYGNYHDAEGNMWSSANIEQADEETKKQFFGHQQEEKQKSEAKQEEQLRREKVRSEASSLQFYRGLDAAEHRADFSEAEGALKAGQAKLDEATDLYKKGQDATKTHNPTMDYALLFAVEHSTLGRVNEQEINRLLGAAGWEARLETAVQRAKDGTAMPDSVRDGLIKFINSEYNARKDIQDEHRSQLDSIRRTKPPTQEHKTGGLTDDQILDLLNKKIK
jgi:hypothetical protein